MRIVVCALFGAMAPRASSYALRGALRASGAARAVSSRRLHACARATAARACDVSTHRTGWDFWRSIGSPRFVAAPMVDQSELPFRMLTRKLGAHLCYTPMLHARLLGEVDVYRTVHFDPHPDDRPCFAQLAGHDPATVLRAAQLVAPHVDAVDLNLGCPQGIARKGHYGAFLLDEPDLVCEIVRTLATNLPVPVTVKVRTLPSLSATVELCRRLADEGASVICVHGRTREQKKHLSGGADWSAITEVVRAVDVPVIANGGIATADDVARCLDVTGAAAVMSSEALLENPALFCANEDPTTREYLDQARRHVSHPPSSRHVSRA